MRISSSSPPSLDQIEWALAFVAHIVVLHGETYAPILERLEREVEAARLNGATARARRILQEFREKAATADPIPLTGETTRQIDDGGRNAMRSSQP